jgi:hypothetical protein
LERGSSSSPAALQHDELTPEDWQEIQFLAECLEPLKAWTLKLEKRGSPCMISEVLPAFDELLTHFEAQRQFHQHAEHPSPHLLTSINAAWAVLNK